MALNKISHTGRVLAFSLLLLLVSVVNSFAQQDECRGFFNHMGLGIGVGTYGARLEVSFPMGDYFTLRGGFSTLPFTVNDKTSVQAQNYRKYIDYNPDLNLDAEVAFSNGHLLASWTPSKEGLFHVTAGIFFGSSNIDLSGILVNPKTGGATVDDLRKGGYVGDELPEIIWDEKYRVKPEKDGRVNADLTLGGSVKPYLGIGIGKTLPQSRVCLNVDIGVIYQGKPDLSSPNLVKGDLNDYLENDESFKPYKTLAKFWPMINFQLIFRIF